MIARKSASIEATLLDEEDRVIEVRDRRTGEREEVPADEVVNHLVRLVTA